MSRFRARRAVLLVAIALSACSDGDANALLDESSSLDAALTAPPVPRAPTTSTAVAPTTTVGAPPTTAPPVPGYWVSPDGDDAAAGTPSAPLRSLNAAAKRLKPGDTLTLAAGTYKEVDAEVAWRIANVNGTAEKPIVITAAPGAQPKIVGGQWATIAILNSSYLTIRGLETVGTATTDKQPTSGIEARDSHHIVFTQNYVHDGGGNGIGTIGSNHIDIVDNYISGMSKWNPFQTSGISVFEPKDIGGGADANGYSVRIVGNVVYGNENIATPSDGSKVVTDGNCIIIDNGKTHQYQGKTYIANNVCSNNGARGIHVFQSANVVAVNNTLYHNMQTAKLKEQGGELSAVFAQNVEFRNNLVIARPGRKLTHTLTAKNIRFINNLYETSDDDPPHDDDRVAVDVGLMDPARGNFALRAGSAAIDAGDPVGAPSADQRGTIRRGKPDIGALEAAS